MERLTFEGDFCDIAQCRELPCPYNGACSQRKVWERLKAYEDTGLTPELVQETAELAIWVHDNGIEKIKEWIKADKNGRLVVLPCKVGDTVWRIKRTFEEYPDRSKPYIEPSGFLLQDVFNISKTVFLTREEAESALEAMKK